VRNDERSAGKGSILGHLRSGLQHARSD